MQAARLHRRLASYYAAFYSLLGAMLPYFGLWLASRDFSPTQIGIVLSLHSGMRIIMPVFWGWVADHTGRRIALIRTATVVSMLAFLGVPLADGFSQMLIAVVVFSLAWNATMPQFEALVLGHIRHTGGDYSRIRLWGSVGFVVAVILLGWLFDGVSLDWLPWIMIACIAWMAVVAFMVDDASELPHHEQPAQGMLNTLRQGIVLAFFAVCFLSQFSFAPYYGFFSLFLEQYGFSRSVIGLLWAFGVVIEIWVFVYTGRLIHRFGAHAMMTLALASTAFRWGMLPLWVDWLPGLLFLQALHLSSFGIFHACAIHFLQTLFPPKLQGRAQALYVSFGFGLGGSLGSAMAGYFWDTFSPQSIYYVACFAGVLGSVIAVLGLREHARP